MTIFVVGLNYKTASIAMREQAYFPTEKLALYLQDLLNRGHAREAVLLSTCNRSELYCEADESSLLVDWFCAQTSLSRHEWGPAIYIHQHDAAIAHIMQVACGLDSMVLGETQILGQMKEAFSESCAANVVGGLFHRLFRQVFKTAKSIRTTTAIGACPVSVASAAFHFAKQQAAQFADANVALIGAGDTVELLARYLSPHLIRPITLVNRSVENAEKLSQTLGEKISIAGLDELPDVLADADIVFSATGSAVPIVNKTMFAEIMHVRQGRSILLFDLAVPRDIDPAVTGLENVILFCIDDLKAHIEENRQGREHAANKAREMVSAKTMEFVIEMKSLDNAATTIRAYRGQIEEICRAELLKARQQLYQGSNAVEVLDAFAHAFTKKLLHAPSVQLRQASTEGRLELLRFAKQLFAIPDHEVEL